MVVHGFKNVFHDFCTPTHVVVTHKLVLSVTILVLSLNNVTNFRVLIMACSSKWVGTVVSSIEFWSLCGSGFQLPELFSRDLRSLPWYDTKVTPLISQELENLPAQWLPWALKLWNSHRFHKLSGWLSLSWDEIPKRLEFRTRQNDLEQCILQ